jgi:hypothetical protein
MLNDENFFRVEQLLGNNQTTKSFWGTPSGIPNDVSFTLLNSESGCNGPKNQLVSIAVRQVQVVSM